MFSEIDVELPHGTLHAYDARPATMDEGRERLVVMWHHGTPNVGEPPLPLLAASRRLAVRWISYDRPGYGGSSARPGRDVSSAADDARAVADALGVERFAVMGHSGGGPHALACASGLRGRVTAVVAVSGLAPFGTDDTWFDGMAPGGAAELRAAVEGPEPLRTLLESAPWDPDQFTAADHAILDGDWGWLGSVAGRACADGVPAGMVDDDLAYVAPWGFTPRDVAAPVLLLHGEDDRVVPVAHARALADRLPSAELLLGPGDGHVSVLRRAEHALEWLVAAAG